MALESDIKDPDAGLFVTFYSKPMQNQFQTELQGRPIFKDVDFVRIILPGDKHNIIDTIARQDHKDRFPIHWARYQNQHGENATEMGTPLSAWPLISAAKAEELRALNFRTVESIAHASDSQLEKLGMAAGMAAHVFRDRARRYLEVARDEGANNEQAERAKKLEEENAKMKSDMDEMKAMIAELAANQKKKPGRKSDAEIADAEIVAGEKGEEEAA